MGLFWLETLRNNSIKKRTTSGSYAVVDVDIETYEIIKHINIRSSNNQF